MAKFTPQHWLACLSCVFKNVADAYLLIDML